MARARTFLRVDGECGVYHVVLRIVDRQLRPGEAEKEAFAGMLGAFAAFHQAKVLTFCVMSNHFHMLVPVPERPGEFDPGHDGVTARRSGEFGGVQCGRRCVLLRAGLANPKFSALATQGDEPGALAEALFRCRSSSGLNVTGCCLWMPTRPGE